MRSDVLRVSASGRQQDEQKSMATNYRKAAPKRKVRRNVRHPELQLAAEIAGVSYSMVYKVKHGEAKSRHVVAALATARNRLRLDRV